MRKPKAAQTIGGKLLWRCSKCKGWLSVAEYYADERTSNGLKSQCRACHTKGNMATRDMGKKRRSNREYMRRARLANPEKFRQRDQIASGTREKDYRVKTRSILNNAIRRGILHRPIKCPRCSRETKITAHHPDYTKPLEVQWLCYECHGEHHCVGV